MLRTGRRGHFRNIPFGDYKPFDPRFKAWNFVIHDYFFAKALDKVRPGGLILFITSKGTLDKHDAALREYVAHQANLLGAIRLPNDAFKRNANTEVTADIVILRKRLPGELPSGPAWKAGAAAWLLRKPSFRAIPPRYVSEELEHHVRKAIETAMRSAMHRAGASALAQLLRHDPPDAGQRTIPCPCGHSAHYKELRSKTMLTVLGQVELSRPY